MFQWFSGGRTPGPPPASFDIDDHCMDTIQFTETNNHTTTDEKPKRISMINDEITKSQLGLSPQNEKKTSENQFSNLHS